jgi:DNA-binding response OmpR family regulator
MSDDKHVILVVDDDPDIRSVMQMVLEGEGYEVVCAETAEEGVRAYLEHDPDLVVVDLMMEEVDAGTNLVKELRALGNQAPIFMLSVVGDSLSDSVDYAELGLSGVLQKPVDPQTLAATVRRKLHKRK